MKIVKFLFLFILLSGLFSLSAQEFFPQSPEVRTLENAYLQAGRVFPLTSFPVGRVTLQRFYEDLGLTLPLEDRNSYFYAGTWFDGNLSSQEILAEPDAPRAGIDIRRAWVDRAPFIRLGATLDSGSGLMAALEMEGKTVWTSDWTNAHNWPKDGGPGLGYRFESQLLARSVLAYDVGGLRFSFGRSPVHIGASQIYGFYPTDILPYLDALRLEARFGRWDLFYMLGSFHPVRSWEGDNFDIGFGDPINEYDWVWNGDSPVPIFYSMHRLQFTGEKFRFAVADQLFMARPNSGLEFNDIFPFGAWHGTDFFPDNLSMMIDLSWAFAPGFVLHGAAAYDDISSDSFGVADSLVPTVDAYLLGLEHSARTEALSARSVLQAGYTHYLFGNYDAQTTAGGGFPYDMPLSRYIARYYMEGTKGFLLPFNTPYGPGSLWLDLKSRVDFTTVPLKVGLDLLVLSKNTQANFITTPFERSTTVENAPRRLWVELGIPVSTKIPTVVGQFSAEVRPSIVAADGRVAGTLDVLVGMEFGQTTGSHRDGP